MHSTQLAKNEWWGYILIRQYEDEGTGMLSRYVNVLKIIYKD